MIFDPMLRNIKKKSKKQIDAWIKDQYTHPVESLHTYDEILGWFKSNDVEFANSIPSCDMISENKAISIGIEIFRLLYLMKIINETAKIASNPI